jgi:glutamate--cysteine ligase
LITEDQYIASDLLYPEILKGIKFILSVKDKKNITLEPGLQFELSGDAVQNIHQTCNEINSYLKELKIVCAKLGIGLLGNGFAPIAKLKDVFKSPKKRYEIMRKYMPSVGRNGLDMMHRTCATQVNLDYLNEYDYKKKSKLIAAQSGLGGSQTQQQLTAPAAAS